MARSEADQSVKCIVVWYFVCWCAHLVLICSPCVVLCVLMCLPCVVLCVLICSPCVVLCVLMCSPWLCCTLCIDVLTLCCTLCVHCVDVITLCCTKCVDVLTLWCTFYSMNESFSDTHLLYSHIWWAKQQLRYCKTLIVHSNDLHEKTKKSFKC